MAARAGVGTRHGVGWGEGGGGNPKSCADWSDAQRRLVIMMITAGAARGWWGVVGWVAGGCRCNGQVNDAVYVPGRVNGRRSIIITIIKTNFVAFDVFFF